MNVQSTVPLPNQFILIFAVSILFISSSFRERCQAESWTDLHGKKTIDARMIGLWGDRVLLELTNGRRVSITLTSLRSESRIQAHRLAKGLAAGRKKKIEDLKQASIAAGAPAPNPLPKPDPAPPYQPPARDAEVDLFVKQIDQAIEAGHIRAIYDSLPPSYRADVDELVRLIVQKIDANEFQKVVRFLQNTGSILVLNQNWVLSSPRVKTLPESTRSQIRGPLMSIAGMAHATKSTELFQLEHVKSMPFSEWISEFDAATCDHLNHAYQTSGTTIKRRAKIESSQNSMTKVDGYWVPTSMNQEKWTTMVSEWKKEINETDGQTWVQPYARYADLLSATQRGLSMADSANDFHAGLEASIDLLTTSFPTGISLFGFDIDFGSGDRQTNRYEDDF